MIKKGALTGRGEWGGEGEEGGGSRKEIARKEVVPQALISNFGLITAARLLKFHFSDHPADDSRCLFGANL